MKIKNITALCMSFSLLSCFETPQNTEFNAKLAWQELEGVIKEQYAYIDRPGIDVALLLKTFSERASTAATKQQFIDTSQMFLRHFFDPHLNLGPYNEYDFSVFPTGSDISARYVNDKFVIDDVKAGAAADIAKIRPSDEIITIDKLPVKLAIENVFGRPFNELTVQQINYGLNVSLGGYRNKQRMIDIKRAGSLTTYQLAASYDSINQTSNGPPVSYKKLDNVGYIRFNNSLGNTDTVNQFQKAIVDLAETKALIIDLRNTPSGGNTGVAEPILGHFVEKKMAYQGYQIQQKDLPYQQAKMQTAFVTPTAPYVNKPFVVLAGRWTGSMGEGMTIGFDAIGAQAIIGAPMADLLGGIKTVTLTQSDAWLELGFERMYHIDNSFREDFIPNIEVIPADRDKNGSDPSLSKAIMILGKNLENSA